MARTKQQKVTKNLPSKTGKTAAKKTRVPAKKTTGKPSVTRKPTSAKKASKKAVVKKAPASKKPAVKKTSAPQTPAQRAFAPSNPSHMQPIPLGNEPWRICIITEQVEWELDERFATKKYAAWKHTQIRLCPHSFNRLINHPEALWKINRLRQNNELNGGSIMLDFTNAYVESSSGERYKVTNVIVMAHLQNPTVLLVWDDILRTELAAINAPVTQA